MNPIPDLAFPERVTIEPMGIKDLDQVMDIENKSFKSPWTSGGFNTELERKPSICLVARDGAVVLGYLVFWVLHPEIHILNIAVKPNLRRYGLGNLLLDYLLDYAAEIGVEEIFLEVRPSNIGAFSLYQKKGFVVNGLRKNYYAEDHEDALLMIRKISLPTTAR
jgi:ribosomal-protein-alanine N-acetyltransferase